MSPLPSLHTHAINAHAHAIHARPDHLAPRHAIHLRLHHHPPLLRLMLHHHLLRILHCLLLRLFLLVGRDTAATRPCDFRHAGIERFAPDLLHLYLRLRWHRARLARMERLLLPGVAMRGLTSSWLKLRLARVRGADMPGHLLVLLLADVFLVGGVLVGLGLRLKAKRLLLLLVLVLAFGGHLMLPVLHLLLGERLLVVLVALLLCVLSLARFLDLEHLFGGKALSTYTYVLRGDGVGGHDGGLGHDVWWATVRHTRDWRGGIHDWRVVRHVGCPVRHLGCSPSAWSLQAALMDHGNAAGWRMTMLER